MVDLDHQKAIACDATFRTNDKKVLLNSLSYSSTLNM
jgi:hypothetical protein